MSTTLNLHALENFKKGDLGHTIGYGVNKITGSGTLPKDSIWVMASEDVQAGKSGRFVEVSESK